VAAEDPLIELQALQIVEMISVKAEKVVEVTECGHKNIPKVMNGECKKLMV
jgi:hypothetical protein